MLLGNFSLECDGLSFAHRLPYIFLSWSKSCVGSIHWYRCCTCILENHRRVVEKTDSTNRGCSERLMKHGQIWCHRWGFLGHRSQCKTKSLKFNPSQWYHPIR